MRNMRVEDLHHLVKWTQNSNCSVLDMFAMFVLEVGWQDYALATHPVCERLATTGFHNMSNLVS